MTNTDDELDHDRYEDDDACRPGKPQCNEDLVRDMMNLSRYGMLCQTFVMNAIYASAQKYSEISADELEAAWGKDAMINARSWHGIATEIKGKLDAFYGRHK